MLSRSFAVALEHPIYGLCQSMFNWIPHWMLNGVKWMLVNFYEFFIVFLSLLRFFSSCSKVAAFWLKKESWKRHALKKMTHTNRSTRIIVSSSSSSSSIAAFAIEIQYFDRITLIKWNTWSRFFSTKWSHQICAGWLVSFAAVCYVPRRKMLFLKNLKLQAKYL